MARVKTAVITKKKHKKILKRAKGFFGAKHYRLLLQEEKTKRATSENYGLLELMQVQE